MRPGASSANASSTRRPTTAIPLAHSDAQALKASDVRAIAEELNGLMVELHEASRRVAAQVDNRATKLEILLQEADAKIARLEQLTGLSTQPPPADPASSRDSNPLTVPHADSPSSAPSHSTPTDPPDPRAQIYDLADRGHSPREIAQLLNTQPGEIELILNLRPQHT